MKKSIQKIKKLKRIKTMRCLSCDDRLTDKEAAKKSFSGNFIDLCDFCFQYIKDELDFIESIESDKEVKGKNG